MNINEYLQNYKIIQSSKDYEFRKNAPRVVCADGFNMSVQVSRNHYCSPRIDDAAAYSEAEVGYPSECEELLMPFVEDSENPTETVYGYVPVEIIDQVIIKHGGFQA